MIHAYNLSSLANFNLHKPFLKFFFWKCIKGALSTSVQRFLFLRSSLCGNAATCNLMKCSVHFSRGPLAGLKPGRASQESRNDKVWIRPPDDVPLYPGDGQEGDRRNVLRFSQCWVMDGYCYLDLCCSTINHRKMCSLFDQKNPHHRPGPNHLIFDLMQFCKLFKFTHRRWWFCLMQFLIFSRRDHVTSPTCLDLPSSCWHISMKLICRGNRFYALKRKKCCKK